MPTLDFNGKQFIYCLRRSNDQSLKEVPPCASKSLLMLATALLCLSTITTSLQVVSSGSLPNPILNMLPSYTTKATLLQRNVSNSSPSHNSWRSADVSPAHKSISDRP